MGPFVVMGVSGCGKSTMSALLAGKTAGTFLEADDFHSPENKTRMASGIPLGDRERLPWITALNARLRESRDRIPVFLACSALKRAHRELLATGLPDLLFLHLRGAPELIRDRLSRRGDHFMPSSLLESQFADLEEPVAGENAITFGINHPADETASEILRQLGL